MGTGGCRKGQGGRREKARWGRKGGYTIFISLKVRSLGVLFSEVESRIEYRLVRSGINYSAPVRSIEGPTV